MSLETLIQQYGLLAVFLGAGIEGETAVFFGGVLAHRHLLSFPAVAAAASAGSFLADQSFFLMGRYARGYKIVRKAIANPVFARAMQLLERHPTLFILSFRFIYGIRTVSPIAIGTSQVPAVKFVLLNALSAAIWGPLIAGVGFAAGNGVEQLVGRLPLPSHLLLIMLATLSVVAALWWVFRRR